MDQTPSNNQVMLGDYPCLIADKGVNGLYLSCETVALDTPLSNFYNLPITIQVQSKAISTCAAGNQCGYTYDFNDSP